MALVPSTSQKPPNAICVLVNDRDNSLLNGLADRLGSLEDGALNLVEENVQQGDGTRHYQFRLDTKYYVANVPIYTFPTFEALLNLMKSREQIQINALIICAMRSELKTEFLARISQYTRELDLEYAEVKALVLKDGEMSMGKEFVMDLVNDVQLQKFCVHKSIELIPLQIQSNSNSDKGIDDNEEGAIGFARVVEILETVRWIGMRMKPNPLERTKHLNRLRRFIQQEEDEFNGFGNKNRRRHKSKELVNFDNEFTQRVSNSKLVNGEMAAGIDDVKNKQKLTSLNFDYPDSDDEAAIMEWFDKTDDDREMSSNLMANKEERRIVQNNVWNFKEENEAEENSINEDICRDLVENIRSDDPFHLSSILGSINQIRQQNNRQISSRGERIAASEGLTYSVLGAISPTIDQSQQRQKKHETTEQGTESTETGSNAKVKITTKKNN